MKANTASLNRLLNNSTATGGIQVSSPNVDLVNAQSTVALFTNSGGRGPTAAFVAEVSGFAPAHNLGNHQPVKKM